MTVLHRQENMPTWHLRCDRCRRCTWHEDAAQEPQAPHICSDCQGAARLLPLEIDHEPGGWVVADRWTLVYGDGPTLPHALWDYLVCLHDWWQLRRADRRREP